MTYEKNNTLKNDNDNTADKKPIENNTIEEEDSYQIDFNDDNFEIKETPIFNTQANTLHFLGNLANNPASIHSLRPVPKTMTSYSVFIFK